MKESHLPIRLINIYFSFNFQGNKLILIVLIYSIVTGLTIAYGINPPILNISPNDIYLRFKLRGNRFFRMSNIYFVIFILLCRYLISWSVMVCWKVSVSAGRDSLTESPSRSSGIIDLLQNILFIKDLWHFL